MPAGGSRGANYDSTNLRISDVFATGGSGSGRHGRISGATQSAGWTTGTPLSGVEPITVGQTRAVVVEPVAGGPFIIPLGQALETDAAQALGKLKTYHLAQGTETDTAQALGALKTRLLVGASETDVAQALTRLLGQTILLVRASETNTAQALGVIKSEAPVQTQSASGESHGRPHYVGPYEAFGYSERIDRSDDDAIALLLSLL